MAGWPEELRVQRDQRKQPGPDEVLEDIRGILGTVTNIDPVLIVPDARWEEFGADRFDFFAVLSALQKRYGIVIPDDDAFEMHKVADLINFVVIRCKRPAKAKQAAAKNGRDCPI